MHLTIAGCRVEGKALEMLGLLFFFRDPVLICLGRGFTRGGITLPEILYCCI